MKKIFLLFLIVVLLFTGCETKANINMESTEESYENIIGVWINYNEIHSLIKKCENEKQLYLKIDLMLKEFAKFKINTIFLHCRAFDDSFYKSNIYQPSQYCLNANNELKFDVLQAFIECASSYKIRIHAWLNPYRIRKDGNVNLINENSLAGSWYSKNHNDQRIIVTNDSIFYNPASIEVQKYILDGVKEILENYKVSGIHIDDYFYPTTSEDIDIEFYNNYVSNGGQLSLADYRRENVSSLISSMYLLIKYYDENLCFSISPSANIDDNYNTHYANIKLWASQKGFTDYLIPQIYFGFEHETMPFTDVLNDWVSIKNDCVKIAVGLAMYKSGEADIFAKSGSNEWIDHTNILKRQIAIINENNLLNGYVFYSSSYILNDYNVILKEEKINIIS